MYESGLRIGNVENAISDVKLWRILINGYPYKTIEELGGKVKAKTKSPQKRQWTNLPKMRHIVEEKYGDFSKS